MKPSLHRQNLLKLGTHNVEKGSLHAEEKRGGESGKRVQTSNSCTWPIKRPGGLINEGKLPNKIQKEKATLPEKKYESQAVPQFENIYIKTLTAQDR